jgi:polyhydroxybutyrate depolymerase
VRWLRQPIGGALLLAVLALAGGCALSGTSPAASSGPDTAGSTAASPLAPERPAPGDHQLAMAWDGKQRTYELHAPPNYRPGAKLPLVVVMHYREGNAAKMRQMTKFDAKADKEGFLVAYPNGLAGAVNALICCGSNDDVGFIKAMVEHISTAWGVDSDRVYATGISNGADMSYRLAVEVPGMFAAIGPVSGGFIGPKAWDDSTYTPKTPVSVVSISAPTIGQSVPSPAA